jgi:Cu2+-exporting ATPase
LPAQGRESLPEELRELGLFDHPDFQQSFVRPVGDNEREAALLLEGITCAACVWLNEQHVARLPGVTAVHINYATRRARVRWDANQIKLSDILAAIRAIGYQAYPYDADNSEKLAHRERRSALWRLFVAGFGMMQVMMYAYPVYLADGDMTADIEQLMRWASLVLTLPVVLYSAIPFFTRAWRDIKLMRVGMDVPVALGVGSAFVASCWATFSASGETYFDSVTMFVFFLLCGRYLEMLARQRAVRGVEELAKVLPAFAERLLTYPGVAHERVPVSQLAVGDVVRVKPGETVPADGVVLEGHSEANEALLTGESRPVLKMPGSELTGGSLNINSPLLLRVTQVGDTTRLATIRRLMERAATEKPQVVEQADRFAARFIVALLVLAFATAGLWWWLDPDRALWVFVSVLVVSCPCALSLATPAALTVATDALARLGVLVTRGHAIEALAKADHFVFDKTGTLTYGDMALAEVKAAVGVDPAQLRLWAASLEQSSEHPIAVGLRADMGATPLLAVSGLQSHTGEGVSGAVAGQALRLGKPSFVAAHVGLPLPAAWVTEATQGNTVVVLGAPGCWLGYFAFRDRLRPQAATLMSWLLAQGKKVSILSGDTPAAVAAVAQSLGIMDAQGSLTPQQKYQAIIQLQQQGAVVAMVGDGVNDAPVLAQAQVSVAMGGGTDLARTQADVVLLGEDLAALQHGVVLAGRSVAIIRQNLWWAFVYNVTAIPAAMTGVITPWMAGIGMSASSLLVVLNALRLQRKNR